MDNLVTSWAPRPSIVALGFAGALASVAGALFDPDKMGVVLFVIAAVVLVALAGHGSVVRPRLSADKQGLRVRTLGGVHRIPWSRAEIRLRTTKRLGRESTTLEISMDEQLFVFGWLELGEDPRDVRETLSSVRG